MDGSAFDRFTRLATTGAARRGVLRSALAALAALAAVTFVGEAGEAASKKAKKVKVCKCPNADPNLCRTKKVAKKKAKKIAKKACNYKGKCRSGVTNCAAGGGGKGPGTLCAVSSECASPFTCALPLNDSGGDKRCCGASGAPCGGDDENFDDQPPICCQGFVCSTDGLGTSTPGTCQPAP